MKRIKRIIVAILLLLAVFLVIAPNLTKNQTSEWAAIADSVNPLIREEKIYVKTAEINPVIQLATNTSSTAYIATSYNDRGQARKICYQPEYMPTAGRYLELVAKGQSIRSWKEVLPAHVPAEARKRLR
ncbi:YxeA family protein [Enterococcus sp. AZ109]|uniref:YxeA family protein n=1 Tax=Enterococcus sp. AZ109 TaxID=2774634 RepID=UPI003F1E47B2